MQHLLAVFEALSLIRQVLDFPALPKLIGHIYDREDQLQDDESACLLSNHIELESGPFDAAINAEENSGNDDVEDDVEEH